MLSYLCFLELKLIKIKQGEIMMKFIELEGGYLVIALFIVVVTIIVTTRDFMSKNAFKIGVPIVIGTVASFILVHYFMTVDRMNSVKARFNSGGEVICESRAIRKVAQSIIISKKLEWKLEGDIFKSDNYYRDFHTARCLEKNH